MDSTRFDDFTKVLATATSRRQALKAIADTVMGGMLGLSGIGKVFAAAPCSRDQCRNRDCCPGLFCDQTAHTCVSCIPSGHTRCLSNDQCCSNNCDWATKTCQ